MQQKLAKRSRTRNQEAPRHQHESIGDVLRSFELRTDPEAVALAKAVASLDDELARLD